MKLALSFLLAISSFLYIPEVQAAEQCVITTVTVTGKGGEVSQVQELICWDDGSGSGGGWDDGGGSWDDYAFCETKRQENLVLGCEGTEDQLAALLWSPSGYMEGSGLNKLLRWMQDDATPNAANQLWAALSNYDSKITAGYGRSTADHEFLTSVVDGCAIQDREVPYVGQVTGCISAYNTLVSEAFPDSTKSALLEGWANRVTGIGVEGGVSANIPLPILGLGVNFSSPSNSLAEFVEKVRKQEVCSNFHEELAKLGCD